MVNQVQVIEQMVTERLTDDPSYFLVEVRIKPTNNVKVFVDGDQGISIEKCVALNRSIYKQLEASSLFPGGDFSLEVSSPGLDEPLKLFRQYVKNTGRSVEVNLKDGRKLEGKLLEVGEDGIVLEETKGKKIHGRPVGKKQEIVLHQFPFDEIKSTYIHITF